MAYLANPFLERRSESATSDQEFIQSFSPKVLERLPEDVFSGGLHIFRSPPGGGKTTILRAFTPPALRAFWNARGSADIYEAFQRLEQVEVLGADGPNLLGVYLSCASGYADLPPGASTAQAGLFRALLNCRVVIRALRGVMDYLGFTAGSRLSEVRLEYDAASTDLVCVPCLAVAGELLSWAEERERAVYAALDSIPGNRSDEIPSHVRFEGILWLQSVRIFVGEAELAPRKLLMIDDLHKLRKSQRNLLIEELAELRPRVPIWLSERNIALGEELIAQGVREGRDVKEYPLEDLWGKNQTQFVNFAQNVVHRRMLQQNIIPPAPLSQYLRESFLANEVRERVEQGLRACQEELTKYRSNLRYSEWLRAVEERAPAADAETLRQLIGLQILIARDVQKRQMAFELAPLSAEELEEKDSSSLGGAADIFAHRDYRIPYYFGFDQLCSLATYNVEQLLSLCAALYDGIKSKQILRKSDAVLSPMEQEKIIVEAARRKRNFIPRNHTEGTRAQKLLDAIGKFCSDRTFLKNAPYAPGVTGIRLSDSELSKLNRAAVKLKPVRVLKTVLAECVAENLLIRRNSSQSSSREAGVVFYLNRILCAHYGLPVQFGGWRDLSVNDALDWMENGPVAVKQPRLEGV